MKLLCQAVIGPSWMWKRKGSGFSFDVFFPLLYNVYTSSQGFTPRLILKVVSFPLICFLSVLPTFLVDETVYYPSFFVSALCYCEPPLCLGPPLSFGRSLLFCTVDSALFFLDLFAISWTDTCVLTSACSDTSKAHIFVFKSVSLDSNAPHPWCICPIFFSSVFFIAIYRTSQSICRVNSTFPVSVALALE